MKNFHILLYSALFGVALALSACRGGAGKDERLLTVSLPPQQYIVEQIAGDRWQVKSLLPRGANPESNEPTMSQLADVERSGAYLMTGNLAFEQTVVDKVTASNSRLQVFDLSKGIDLITGTHGECAHGHHHCSDDADPHTWSSVKNARIMAANARDALTRLDPDGADYYATRYASFASRLDSLDRAIAAILAQGTTRRFVVWHPSLSYFARDYGLEQIAIGAENKELSTAGLRRKIEQARGSGERVSLLLQRDFDTRQAQALGRELDADVSLIDPLNPNWEEEMTKTAMAVAGLSTGEGDSRR